MDDQGNNARPINSFMRLFLRVPIIFYHLGLANRLARRGIMLLETRGRRTGRHRVSGVNYAMVDRTAYVAAGWGTRTGWYRNLLDQPEVTVQIGGVMSLAHARPVLDEAEQAKAVETLAAIDGGPPRPLRPLLSRLGFDFDAERAEAFADPTRLTFVALELSDKIRS